MWTLWAHYLLLVDYVLDRIGQTFQASHSKTNSQTKSLCELVELGSWHETQTERLQENLQDIIQAFMKVLYRSGVVDHFL